MDSDDLIEKLEAVSEREGIPYQRIQLLLDQEVRHTQAAFQYREYIALSDAFKCFFLETLETLNDRKPLKESKEPAEPYAYFLPKLALSFRTLCGAERAALQGYPCLGYTALRPVFDALVHASAVLQHITSFCLIDSLMTDSSVDYKGRHRYRSEHRLHVRQAMSGDQSGLDPEVIAGLAEWDVLFEFETSSAQQSLTGGMDSIKQGDLLRPVPSFDRPEFEMFIHRFMEVAWLAHRLLPCIQREGFELSEGWRAQWPTINSAFEQVLNKLADGAGARSGRAFIAFALKKFPFDQKSTFSA